MPACTGTFPCFVTHELEQTGVYEIVVAPSDPNRLYMGWEGHVFKSVNKGTTWTKTNFTALDYETSMNPNMTPTRWWGEKMAVDPSNPDKVYIGTQLDGMFFTNDAGANWNPEPEVPDGTPGQGVTGIIFESSSVIYATANGTGIYRSGDSGANWTQVGSGAGGTSPNSSPHVATSPGVYYTSDAAFNIWKYIHSTTTWTKILAVGVSSQNWHSITVDPADPTRLVVGAESGALIVSHNSGAGWDTAITNPTSITRVATDIPWLANTEEIFMSNGAIKFDPAAAAPNKLWFANGIGVWTTTVTGTPTTTVWTSQSKGIEQLVSFSITSTPGGMTILGTGDRPTFKVVDPAYPSQHGLISEVVSGVGPVWRFGLGGFQVTYTSANTESVLAVGDGRWIAVGGADQKPLSALTTDGLNWTQFAKYPAGSPASADPNGSRDSFCVWGFGSGAALSTSNILLVPGITGFDYSLPTDQTGCPRRSPPGSARRSTRLNGGATWTAITLPTSPTNTS